MDRKQELALRLLGSVGFVVVLLFLPILGHGCSASVPEPNATTPAAPVEMAPTASPTPSPAASSTPVSTSPTASPTSSPTAYPTPIAVTQGTSPLLSPLASPLATPTAIQPAQEAIPVYAYRVVEAYPHDQEAWTQGLVYHQGVLYEGTGLQGRSSLRTVDLETGEVDQLVALPDQFFGEGIAIFADRIFQLTWHARVGFIYDLSFERLGEFAYSTEGWGLTHDGTHLIMSDGTPVLHFLDPEDLSEVRQVQVHDANGLVTRLNELEYVHGEVYANVWQTDRIVRIDPQNGNVLGWIDLSGLLPAEDRARQVDVLNGIAYDAEGDRLFVTGKLWSKLFEIELIPPQ